MLLPFYTMQYTTNMTDINLKTALEEVSKMAAKLKEERNEALEGARHGTDVGLELAIKCLEDLRVGCADRIEKLERGAAK